MTKREAVFDTGDNPWYKGGPPVFTTGDCREPIFNPTQQVTRGDPFTAFLKLDSDEVEILKRAQQVHMSVDDYVQMASILPLNHFLFENRYKPITLITRGYKNLALESPDRSEKPIYSIQERLQVGIIGPNARAGIDDCSLVCKLITGLESVCEVAIGQNPCLRKSKLDYFSGFNNHEMVLPSRLLALYDLPPKSPDLSKTGGKILSNENNERVELRVGDDALFHLSFKLNDDGYKELIRHFEDVYRAKLIGFVSKRR